jgi:hypothetical protein
MHSVQKVGGIYAQAITHCDEIDDIQPTFAEFIFGDEGLDALKAFGYLRLRQSSLLARLDERRAQLGIDRAVQWCGHGSYAKAQNGITHFGVESI